MDEKRVEPLLVLLTLQKHTDVNHPLSLTKVSDVLYADFGFSSGRATLRKILTSLMEEPVPDVLQIQDRSKSSKRTAFYLESLFSFAELDYLIDVVYFARDLTYQQKVTLIEKLYQLNSEHYEREHKKVNLDHLKDKRGLDDYFDRYRLVQQAIRDHKKIYYRSRHDNPYEVSPLAIVRSNDTVFVLAKVDEEEDPETKEKKNHIISLALFTLNDLKVLDKKAESSFGLVDFTDGNLWKFVKTHRDNWNGILEPVSIEFAEDFEGNLMRDFAPPEYTIRPGRTPKTKIVHFESTENAIVRYALENSQKVTVLKPDHIIERLKKEFQKGLDKYS